MDIRASFDLVLRTLHPSRNPFSHNFSMNPIRGFFTTAIAKMSISIKFVHPTAYSMKPKAEEAIRRDAGVEIRKRKLGDLEGGVAWVR